MNGYYMDHKLETIGAAIKVVLYTISGWLISTNWLEVVDHHAPAFGVMLGALTLLANIYFQRLNHRILAKANGERRKYYELDDEEPNE